MATKTSDSKITVIGIGGAGGNMLNSMIDAFADFKHVEFIAVNTDAFVLERCRAATRLHIGMKLASDGSGGVLSKQNSDAISALLADASHVIIVAGMGGETGTYIAPIVADIVNEINAARGVKEIRTTAIVTTPFTFEGVARQRRAQMGIDELIKYTADVHVISNDKILEMSNNGMSTLDAFKAVDERVCLVIKDLIKDSEKATVGYHCGTCNKRWKPNL